MDYQMKNEYEWEIIDAFCSLSEFKNFIKWIEKQVLEKVAVEIPVEWYYRDPTKTHTDALNAIRTNPMYYYADEPLERWFKNLAGDIWRLVSPDPPSSGCWQPVDESKYLWSIALAGIEHFLDKGRTIWTKKDFNVIFANFRHIAIINSPFILEQLKKLHDEGKIEFVGDDDVYFKVIKM